MSQAVVEAIKAKFADAVLATDSRYGDESVTIKRDKLLEVCTFLKEDDKMAFDLPVFLTCTDWLGLRSEGPRFELVVQLRSLSKHHRIRVKVPLEENSLQVASISSLWIGFDWLERECYDMYGIEFQDHPDLRRIYLYPEFQGHPLRKDYPKDKRQPLVRRDWTDE
jgi:NADH-quinone oxidoreductase subunit C